jgi:catechol 2,3-dioxygenase-like lactoylglutathione lyase family enzyme
MMRGLIHHIDLTVRDPQKSKRFYEEVLGFMGYRIANEHERGIDFDLSGHNAFNSIGIMKAQGPNAGRTHDRYSVGLHHVAFSAESRTDVDRLHAFLLEIGARVLDAPADYPHYGEGYYAVFFADPDGLKFEYVYQRRA